MPNYTRGGQTFKSTQVAGVDIPGMLAGELTRVHDGIQSLTLTTASQTLTVPAGATHALIYCDYAADTDEARYWHGATAPTSTVGKRLKAHEEISSAAPSVFRAIIGAGAPILRVEFYHYE